MRSLAAPVTYPAARGGLWRWLWVGCSGLAAASLAAWLTWHGALAVDSSASTLDLGIAALLGLLAGGLAGRQGWVGPGFAQRVVWDGSHWRLDACAAAVPAPQCVLDGGRWLLLRWPVPAAPMRPWGGHRWFVADAADDPAAWRRLRLAVRHSVPAVQVASAGAGEVAAP